MGPSKPTCSLKKPSVRIINLTIYILFALLFVYIQNLDSFAKDRRSSSGGKTQTYLK